MRRSDRAPGRSTARGSAGHAAGQMVQAAGRTKKARQERSQAVATIEIRPAGTVVSRRGASRRPAIRHLPEHPAVPVAPPSWMLEECHVAPARAGDQSEILQLLAGLPAAPTKAEFHAAVDHPDHDAANRLVARLAGRIVGHVEVMPRTVLLDGAPIAAAAIDRVAVLPECRGAGHGQRLVQAAEDRMRQCGAWVGLARTRIAASFHELGWAVLGRDCATPGRPTEILARLLEGPPRAGEPVTMRQWRHVELPAILRIYRQNAARFVGPLDRSEAYSRWLISRGAFDSIIVALVGQDRYELHETTARIVGYAIQSGNRVLELMADPEFPGLEREILARVCAEAVENDRQEIVYEAGASDPLHAAVAGGESAAAVAGDRMIVAKLFRPLETLTALVPNFARRIAAAGIREPVELGLEAPSFRGSIIVSEAAKGEAKATVQAGRVGRSYLRLPADELARLVLGQCDPQEAVAAGRLEPSTQVAVKLAAQLFPRTPLWCPMWDDLPA
ncbi:MAG: N-acetyltransferase [Planctomycetia bacterium]|nr:N-acetyltransferase [Planctomycetia bacterium]